VGGDPTAAVVDWVAAFNARELDTLCALYTPDAVLWGTLATQLLTDPAAIRGYFERAWSPALDTRVELLDLHLQHDGPLAIAAGGYRLEFLYQGRPHTQPARYSFVLVATAQGWRVRHHHSSMMPAQPAPPGAPRSG
jgi:ketosteroid isomerase-like protein